MMMGMFQQLLYALGVFVLSTQPSCYLPAAAAAGASGNARLDNSQILNDSPRAGQTGQVVRSRVGAVFGAIERTANKGVTYHAFKGIPYAVPPLGDLRFKDPVPYPTWQGMRLATGFKDYCVGFLFSFVTGDEDCLYLNVYVPRRPSSGMKPASVVFWIHGGGFQHGSDFNSWMYYPGAFLEKDVVFVTPFYRLGPLGFLSTDDDVAPGNYGMKDVILALQWTKDNIADFGGDPDSITVMGQSAGAVMAHLLAFSPAAQGLFRAGVSLSGSATQNWGIHPQPRLVANRLAETMKCPSHDSAEMVRCLRQRGAKELVYAVQEFHTLPGPRYAIPFAPRVDRGAAFPVLPKHPLMMILDSRFQPKPWIFGFTKDEAISFYWGVYYDKDRIESMDATWGTQCKKHVYASLGSEEVLPPPNQMVKLCRKARKVYFGNKRIDFNSNRQFTEAGTDALIAFGTVASAILQSRLTRNVWFYRYDHVNGHATFLQLVNSVYDQGLQFLLSKTNRTVPSRIHPGAGHGDDLFLLMSPPEFPKLTPDDARVQGLLSKALTSFIKYTDPNMDEHRGGVAAADDGVNSWWPRFTEEGQEFLTIDVTPGVSRFPLSKDRLALWAKCYDVLNRNYHRFPVPSLVDLLGTSAAVPVPPLSSALTGSIKSE